MTSRDALKLKRGDKLRVKFHGGHEVTVVRVLPAQGPDDPPGNYPLVLCANHLGIETTYTYLLLRRPETPDTRP